VSSSRKKRVRMSSKKLIKTKTKTSKRWMKRRVVKTMASNNRTSQRMVKMQTLLSPTLLPLSTRGKRRR